MSAPSPDCLRTTIAGAASFIAGQQGEDQLWHDFTTLAGEGSEWVTGFVAANLGQCGLLRDEVRAAARGLLRRQRRTGGWGYNERVPPDCDSSAWVLLGLATTTMWKPSFVLGGLQYVLRHSGDVGFSTYSPEDCIERYIGASADQVEGWTTPHQCVTAVALRALLVHGLSKEPRVTAGVIGLCDHQQPDGLWTSYWWEGPHYATAQVLRVLVAARALKRSTWTLAVKGLMGGQSASGAFGGEDAFATAMALTALTTWPDAECTEAKDRAAAWLVEAQRGGRWPSSAILRIPRPKHIDPEAETLRTDVLGAGVKAVDHNGVFTASACIAALADYRLQVGVKRAFFHEN